MACDVCIEQKGFFKRKKFTIEDLVHMSHLAFGSVDENNRLIPNQISRHTLLFDRAYLQRGIELYIENHDIWLRLSFPTSMDEIQLFYYLIKLYCEFMEQDEFVRDMEYVSVNDIDLLMAYDKRTSADALRDLMEKETDSYFTIYGVLHPISIGKRELDYFQTDLDLFGNYLHSKQQMDAYYAAPRIYDIHGIRTGMFAIGANLPTILPVEPDTFCQVDRWLAVLDTKCIPYKDFLDSIDQYHYYDANHRLIVLTQEKIEQLFMNCREVEL